MLFVATCIDKPDCRAKRTGRRPAHLVYLSSLGAKVRAAGALLDPTGQNPVGSLLIFDVLDEAEARAILAADPYAEAELFASVDLKPWRQALGVTIAR
jgi:uncharacterized protein YciI